MLHAEIGSHEAEPLVYTKIRVPSGRGSSIARSRLLERIDDASRRRVTLVSAPAGYGKTTLLRCWAESRPGPTPWLALDSRDDDPTRLSRYLAAACGEAGLPVTDCGRAPTPDQILPSLINTIADCGKTVALVLDDIHTIESMASLRALAFLLDHLPDNARLVLSSRVDPPLPLAKLRAYGELSELRSADLRFTLDEMSAFFEERASANLSLDQLLRLQEKTEGWPAGLQLIAHLLRSERDLTKIIDTFTGDHPYLLEYLSGEVLAGMPPEDAQFLYETSILPELDAELCQRVTGRGDCQQLLERLHADNLFIEPIGPALARFRYHSLFREQLRRRLEASTDPARVADLHERACRALLTRKRIQDAIPHAIAAGLFELAADLISNKAQAAMNAGDAASLQRWLADLPEHIVQAEPQLAIWQAWSCTISGQLDEVERWLAVAEANPGPGSDVDIAGQALTIRSTAARFRGDLEAATLAQEAIDSLGPGRPILHAIGKLNLGEVCLRTGRPLEGEAHLLGAIAEARALGHRYVAASAQFHLGKSYLRRGLLEQASTTFEIAGRRGASSGEAAPLSVSNLGLALLALEADDLPAAARHLERAIYLSRWIGDYVFLLETQQALVRLYLAKGDGAQAAHALQALIDHLDQASDDHVMRRHLAALRAQVDEVTGDRISAVHWAEQAVRSAADHPGAIDVDTLAVAVRLVMPHDAAHANLPRLRLCHALLKQAEVQADQRSQRLPVLRARLLRASLLAIMQRSDQARRLLRQAVADAPAGMVRPFLEAGEPLLTLLDLESIEPMEDSEHYQGRVAGLITAFSRHGLNRASQEGIDPAERLDGEILTEREVEVLALLARGHTSREVAEELVIAFNTARTHVRNIYRKLDVHNRVEAVDQARRAQLV